MAAVLTIAGSDPSGCAGLQLDLRVLAALGAHGSGIPTTLTIQNTRTCTGISPVSADVFERQLRVVLEDQPIDAIKIGLLGDSSQLAVLVRILGSYSRIPVVLDPVVRASSGFHLLRALCVRELWEQLAPHVTLLTPNADEAARLTGEPVSTIEEASAAAHRLQRCGAAVLLKGGHLGAGRGTDVLVVGGRERLLKPCNLAANSSVEARGTGCVLSTAIAAFLAQGLALVDAVSQGRLFVTRARLGSYTVGGGPAVCDPLFASPPQPVAVGVGRLHVITDTQLQDRFSHVELAQRALQGGANTVQLRHKVSSSTRELHGIASQIEALCEGAQANFVVNDRADVAGACRAGVHLGPSDMPVSAARRLLGPRAVVGATVNDEKMARAAQHPWVDYWGVGPVFETYSKVGARQAIGLGGLRHLISMAPVPVIAIGGIQPDNVAEVLAQGAYGVAVLGGVTRDPDPTRATARYREALQAAVSRQTDRERE